MRSCKINTRESELKEASPQLLVGVRHILDVESPDWLLREDVHRGLQVLMEEDLVFDCLVRPPILKHVATIGKTHELQREIVTNYAL